MENTMKLIAEYPVGTLRNATTVNNLDVVALALKNMPGVGKPFLIFQSLPGQVVAADFDQFPDYKVSVDVAANRAMIDAMLANPPTDALAFA